MSSWASGYVADLGYTYGYYRELTPELLRFVTLAKGLDCKLPSDRLTYCELGCGQGFSANLIAAANPNLDLYALDFNPAHIAGAQQLAEQAGTTNVHFLEQSFAEALENSALPDFDIICLHGIYSWVAAEHRSSIVEFLRRKLKPGGLAYVSYNALPGWAPAAPLRHLMYLHGKSQGGPTAARLAPALEFATKVRDLGANYFSVNPTVGPRLDKLKLQQANYLAHEYLNDAWTLLYFSDVAGEMSEAKLSFAASAAPLEHVDALNLSEEQQKLILGIADPVLREVVRDYLVNQQFRRDVFVKGVVHHAPSTAREAWLNTRFALSVARDGLPMTVRGARGEAQLQAEIYEPLLDAFASGPRTLRQVLANQKIADLGWARFTQGIIVLVGAGWLHPALPERDEEKRRKRTRQFNNVLLQRARYSADYTFMASPTLGAGVPVGRIEQLFILSMAEKDPAESVWRILEAQGHKIIKEGKTLETAEENIAELRSQQASFEKRLPVLKSIGVVS